MHFSVQNPPKPFWITLVVYVMIVVLARLIYQIPVFCDCGGTVSVYPRCATSPNFEVREECGGSALLQSSRPSGTESLVNDGKDMFSSTIPGRGRSDYGTAPFFGFVKAPSTFFVTNDVGGRMSPGTVFAGWGGSFFRGEYIVESAFLR